MTEYVCIICPNSCRLQVEERDGELIVTGNECKRGIAHGIHEHTNPERMITTTVAIQDGPLPRLPVISTGEVPKAKLRQCLDELYRVRLKTPINCGDVVVSDLCGTGVDVVASRTMKRKDD